MALFSFLKSLKISKKFLGHKKSLYDFFVKEKQLKCDWCGKEIETISYSKYIHNKKFNFCSETCKKNFRKSGRGRGVYRRCPTCVLAPKSWNK